MPVTDRTLRHAANLRASTGRAADRAVRVTTTASTQQWGQIADAWQAAAVSLTADGNQPSRWQTARNPNVIAADLVTVPALAAVAAAATTATVAAVTAATAATAVALPAIVASQLPEAGLRANTTRFAGLLSPDVAGKVADRHNQRSTNLIAALPERASQAIRHAVTAAQPNATTGRSGAARALTRRVEAAFHTVLAGAITVARTEVADACRAVTEAAGTAYTAVVGEWVWLAELDPGRTCVACWVMHGSRHPNTTPGPQGHPGCRCQRLPVARSWAALGLSDNEPANQIPDARTIFDSLPQAKRLQVLGPTRLALLDAGLVDWPDLVVRRANSGWRAAYMPRTVADLHRLTGLRTRRAA